MVKFIHLLGVLTVAFVLALGLGMVSVSLANGQVQPCVWPNCGGR